MRRRGHTLAELVVGAFVLSLLMLMMFFIYQQGAHAWKKAETQTELLQQAQVVTSRLSRDVERSVYASASVDPGAVAFLTCWDEVAERFDYDPLGKSPIWHKYVIWYYDSAQQEVRCTEAPFTPASPTAAPLAGLAGFCTGGRVMAENVYRCDFTLSEHVLLLELELRRKRYGSEAPETVQLPCRMFFRN